MRYLKPTLITCAALLASGCATLEDASTSFSCMLSRATNSANAHNCGGPATGEGHAPADRFGKLQSVLDQEAQRARTAQVQAVSAMQGLPPGQRALAGSVRMVDVTITDSQSRQMRRMRALESVSVSMPLAAKGRPEYTRAMDTLKNLANELANNRGASSIVVDQAEADVRANRVNTSTGTTQTGNGKPVSVLKNLDRTLPAGMERYTIQAGEIRGQL
jgi:hypothetical protein